MPNPPNNQDYLDQLRADCATFRARHRLAPISEHGYACDWRRFIAWCSEHQRVSFPSDSETLTLYVAGMLARGNKISTAHRHVWAVRHRHKAEGIAPPSALDSNVVLSGAQRIRLERPRQMEPLTVADAERICAACDGGRKNDLRDRAVILTGFASALRRSSLSALDLADVEFTGQGVILHIRKEKQDQEGKGRMIGLPHGSKPATCPVASLRAWIQHRGDDWAGPLFTRMLGGRDRLRPPAIAEIVKTRVKSIGRDPSQFAGHSLRAGFVTEAGECGVSDLLIAAQTGHRSLKMVRRYFRRRDLWKANAAAMIGL
jgi:integrase